MNLRNILENDDNGVDYTIAMESPLVAAAAGYGYYSLNFALNCRLKILLVLGFFSAGSPMFICCVSK